MTLKPGDIIEIETSSGLAYVQVTHNHPAYPEVVRALTGLHKDRPSDLEKLAGGQSRFRAMVNLGSAMEQKRLTGARIGNLGVPAEDLEFPTFRMPIRDKKGNVAYWWLWDGTGLSYVTELDANAQSFPMREVTTVSALIDRLATSAD